MKIYTQKEFDTLPVIHGVRQCPTGDYSNIRSFGKRCSFGVWCSFGEWCSFGKCCSFGEYCSLGEYCSFGEYCLFGKYCSFGKCCSFGEWCSFGEYCLFGEFCSFEGLGKAKEGIPFIQINNIGSRGDGCTIYNLERGVYVRCGCYLGSVDEFKDRVTLTHKDNDRFREQYLLSVKLAEVTF